MFAAAVAIGGIVIDGAGITGDVSGVIVTVAVVGVLLM